MCRLFERVHIAALRVHAGHHVFDRAVFAGSIHALENQQHRPAILREQQLLHAADDLAAFFEQLFSLFLVFNSAGVRAIAILEPEFVAIGNAMRFGEPHRLLDQF